MVGIKRIKKKRRLILSPAGMGQLALNEENRIRKLEFERIKRKKEEDRLFNDPLFLASLSPQEQFGDLMKKKRRKKK